ncbi:MAG: PKD domain-containing protein [Candidatus Thermoplasmatota archaeon]|nr:PKD domain-containing protein [Candidatus Thermoplasmatota archaeon]
MKSTCIPLKRYWQVGFVVSIVLLTTGSLFGASEQTTNTIVLTHTVTFPTPQVHQRSMNDQVLTQITLPGAPGVGDPGEPNLPAYGISFLLPQGATVTDISVQPGVQHHLASDVLVEPVEQPVPLSALPTAVVTTLCDESIYTSAETFPGSLFRTIGVHHFRGYGILYLVVFPVSYRPLEGELFYYSEMTVTVQTTHTTAVHPLFRNSDTDQQDVINKVHTSDTLATYGSMPHAPLSAEHYDLLILTTDELKDHFIPLKDAHDAHGIPTEIKTLSDVSWFPSFVTPEDIRELITEEYITKGITSVLIGGDADVFPTPLLYVQAGGDTDTLPSDLYYACLDGTYNYDNDEYWGERYDGDGGGDVDLIAEVYVGRAAVGDALEADNFVHKTLAYMSTGGYSSGPVVMVGEYLWGPPNYPVTFGGDSMEELVNGSSAHQYTTLGFPAETYSISRLYDHSWPGFNLSDPWETGWPKSEIMNTINSGVHYVNHLGHSGTTYNMRMGADDIESLTNTMLPFIYSQGCYAGAFDLDDSMAEYYTVKTTHAAFACILCARYGWGTPGSTDGPNQRYHRQFWDAVFQENITSIGKANQDSKEDNVYRINGPCMRWCYYEMNLFGDPTLEFFIRQNTAPDIPEAPLGTKKGEVGQTYTFTSMTSDAEGDLVYYKWSFGDGTFSPWLGPYLSGQQVNTTHSWTTWGRYEVKVKARDQHREESDWSDPLPVRMPFVPTLRLVQRLYQILQHLFPQLFVAMMHS